MLGRVLDHWLVVVSALSTILKLQNFNVPIRQSEQSTIRDRLAKKWSQPCFCSVRVGGLPAQSEDDARGGRRVHILRGMQIRKEGLPLPGTLFSLLFQVHSSQYTSRYTFLTILPGTLFSILFQVHSTLYLSRNSLLSTLPGTLFSLLFQVHSTQYSSRYTLLTTLPGTDTILLPGTIFSVLFQVHSSHFSSRYRRTSSSTYNLLSNLPVTLYSVSF